VWNWYQPKYYYYHHTIQSLYNGIDTDWHSGLLHIYYEINTKPKIKHTKEALTGQFSQQVEGLVHRGGFSDRTPFIPHLMRETDRAHVLGYLRFPRSKTQRRRSRWTLGIRLTVQRGEDFCHVDKTTLGCCDDCVGVCMGFTTSERHSLLLTFCWQLLPVVLCISLGEITVIYQVSYIHDGIESSSYVWLNKLT